MAIKIYMYMCVNYGTRNFKGVGACLLNTNPEGNRRPGRPKRRWKESFHLVFGVPGPSEGCC